MYVLLIRTVIMFFAVVVLVKVMGRRTIGELQVSELVVTLLISNIAALPMQDTGVPLLAGLIPVSMLVVLEIVISSAMLKFPRIKRLVNGAPIAVLTDGKIDRDALRALRMTAEDLFQSLRKKDIFDITSVAYAIIESDGTLSALQYSDSQPPNAADLGVKPAKERMNVLLVCDGVIDKSSESFLKISRERIYAVLKNKGMTVDQVFIMTADTNGKFDILETNED